METERGVDHETRRTTMRWTYLLLAVAVVLFAAATAYGFFKLRQESDTADYNSQAAVWLVVSFEREYLKFDGMLWRYGSGDPALAADELLTQFDVLWSRIELMEKGANSRPLRQVESYQHVVPATFKLISDYEAQIFSAVPAGRPLPKSFIEGYHALANPIHRFMVDVHINRSWSVDVREAQIRDVRIAIYLTLAGTLGSTLLLFGVVFIQLKGRHDNLMRTLAALSQSENDRNALRDEVRRREMAENERKALMLDLEARNEELERYAYTISHDLKSPLYTIQGFTGFLERDIGNGDADRMRNDLAKIKEAVLTMANLLDDILNLSRVNLEIESLQEVSLELAIEEAMSMLSREIREHEVNIQIAPGLPQVFGEPQRLIEVFQNLISNAVKFMGDQENPQIEIGASVEGDWVHCYVSDNGIGISSEYRERVFNLFERLESNTQGTGVGLAIVKRIIERLGGSIKMQSAGLGLGSRFEFTLPISAAIK